MEPTIESVEDHFQSAVVVVSRQNQSVDVTPRAVEDIPPGKYYVSGMTSLLSGGSGGARRGAESS